MGEPLFAEGQTWTSDDNLGDARTFSKNTGITGVTTFSWWTAYGGGGVAGMAWVGTLCHSNYYGTNINEKMSTAAQSAYVNIRLF